MTQRYASLRRGMSLIELLTTISVIGAMATLLLPALQSAREAARASSCANNLKQAGLALESLEASRRAFPPSKVAAKGPETGPCDPFEAPVEDNPSQCTAHASWTAFCLDYLEQAPLARMYRREISWSSLGNRAAVGAQLALFMCPSAPRDDRIDSHFVHGAAAADYAVISQVEIDTYTDVFGVLDPGVEARRGVLAEYADTPARLVEDGLSHTIFLAESAGRPAVYAFGRLVNDESVARVAGDEVVVVDGRYVPDDGIGWADPETVLSVKGAVDDRLEPFGPCMINAHNLGEAYSFHHGRALFLFADGSVRSLQEDVDPWVYVCLCTRAGGEVVSVAH